MKRLFKPGEISKGIRLALLWLVEDALDAIPILGAGGGRGVLGVIKGIIRIAHDPTVPNLS